MKPFTDTSRARRRTALFILVKYWGVATEDLGSTIRIHKHPNL